MHGGPPFAVLLILLLLNVITINQFIFNASCFRLKVATDLRVEVEKILEELFLLCASECVIVCFAFTL